MEHPSQRVYLDSESAEVVDAETRDPVVSRVRGDFIKRWSVVLALIAVEGALALRGCDREEQKPVPNCQGVPGCIDEHVVSGPGGVPVTVSGEEVFSPED